MTDAAPLRSACRSTAHYATGLQLIRLRRGFGGFKQAGRLTLHFAYSGWCSGTVASSTRNPSRIEDYVIETAASAMTVACS